MKKQLLCILISSILFSCSGRPGADDARACAYQRAFFELSVTVDPAEMETISYELYKELSRLDATLTSIGELKHGAMSGNEEYAAILAHIELCRENFERLLSLRTMPYYIGD